MKKLIGFVVMAVKSVIRAGDKIANIFCDGREKFIRAYRGKLRFSPDYERLLVYSLIRVMRVDGKISLFEAKATHAIVKLYRALVGRPASDEQTTRQVKEILGEISNAESDELIAAATPMSESEKYFLTECALHVAQWDGLHCDKQIFIQYLADEIGVKLPPDIFEKAHKAGMKMTAKLRRSHPELRDD